MIEIYSYGVLHNDARDEPLPEFTMTFDLRRRLRDPHVDPAFRELNGHDSRVVDKVLGTEGAQYLIAAIASAALRFSLSDEPTRVGISCAGGRHRSVVVADQVFNTLSNLGEDVRVNHIDMHRPVVRREKEVSA